MSGRDLKVWREGHIGRLQLDRPEALNALTHAMALEMEKALLEWRGDEKVGAVVVSATGERAFCAGGDIQDLYHTGRKDPGPGRRFWRDEYRLNALIHSYPKPYVALMNGITMGGGVGISAHGSHRVVTGNSMLAMPEVSIGFLPDVGGTWILSRAPGETGLYLGMSGARMNAADAIYAGFADHYCQGEKLPELVAALAGGCSPDEALPRFEEPPPDGTLKGLQGKITRAFSRPDAMSCVRMLERMAAEGDDWAEKTRVMIARNSPLSVAAAFAAIHRARGLETLEDCLGLEYCFAYRSLTGTDFLEGIRAMVIDKDKQPNWCPPSLEEVTGDMVDQVLAPLGEQEWKAA